MCGLKFANLSLNEVNELHFVNWYCKSNPPFPSIFEAKLNLQLFNGHYRAPNWKANIAYDFVVGRSVPLFRIDEYGNWRYDILQAYFCYLPAIDAFSSLLSKLLLLSVSLPCKWCLHDYDVQALRFFVGEPVWTPYNRPHDHLPARYDRVNKFSTLRQSDAPFLCVPILIIIWFQCADNNMSRILWKRILPTMLLIPQRKIYFCQTVVRGEKYQDSVAKVKVEKRNNCLFK